MDQVLVERDSSKSLQSISKKGLVVRCSDRVVFPASTCLLFALTTKPLRVVTGLQVRGYQLQSSPKEQMLDKMPHQTRQGHRDMS